MNQLKQNAKHIIEYLGLGQSIDKARFYLQYLQQKRKINAFKASHPGMPLPRPFMIYETFRLDYQRYIDSGKADAKGIYDEVKEFIDLNNKSILDWGCGPGRIIRYFPGIVPSAKLYASDYNKSYINWCQKNLKAITFKENFLSPPLLFENNSMDFCYAISIFTHLSTEKHYKWIDEIYRILSPGAVFYFTTHGAITRKNLLETERIKYDSGTIVERGNVKEGYRMYTAYHPVPFIKKLLSGKFEILKHRQGIEKPWGLEQDVWIARKKQD